MAGTSLALHGVLCALSWLMVAYGSRHALQGWQRMRQAHASSGAPALPIVRREILVWTMAMAAQVIVVIDIVHWAAWGPSATTGYPNYHRVQGSINFLCYISATIMISLTLVRFSGIMAKPRFWHRANRAGTFLLPVLCTIMCLSTIIHHFYDDLVALFVHTPSWLVALRDTKRTIFLAINGVSWTIYLFFDLSAIIFTFKTVLVSRRDLASMKSSPITMGAYSSAYITATQATFLEINKQILITTMCAAVSVLDLLLYIYTLTPWFGPQSLVATIVTFCLTLHYLSVTLMMDSLKALATRQPHEVPGTSLTDPRPLSDSSYASIPAARHSQILLSKTGASDSWHALSHLQR